MKLTLGKLAFERFSSLFRIDHARGTNGVIIQRPGTWEEMNDAARFRWEEFACGYANDVILFKARAEGEKERKAMRSDLFEQEVRRQISERIGK